MSEPSYIVNKNIKRLLDETKQKACRVAQKAGMTEKVFSNIVHCKRKVYADEVMPIASAMGVSLEDLFAESAASSSA